VPPPKLFDHIRINPDDWLWFKQHLDHLLQCLWLSFALNTLPKHLVVLLHDVRIQRIKALVLLLTAQRPTEKVACKHPQLEAINTLRVVRAVDMLHLRRLERLTQLNIATILPVVQAAGVHNIDEAR
jgi:hypothetical protein